MILKEVAYRLSVVEDRGDQCFYNLMLCWGPQVLGAIVGLPLSYGQS